MPTPPTTTSACGLGLALAALLTFVGCAAVAPVPTEALRDRILALDAPPPPAEPETLPPPRPVEETAGAAKPPAPAGPEPAGAFTLPDAIAFGFQNNPRLRMARAAIDQARGNEQAAFAPYLPVLSMTNRVVTVDSNLRNVRVDTEPVTGYGNSHQEFSQEEVNLYWTIVDFGRRSGRYAQAGLRVDIAQLQASRADQTVAYDVSVAYYRLLFTRATRVVARQAVRRAESVLQLTQSLFREGVLTRDTLLRAEVQLAEVRQQLVSADSSVRIAEASLNYAMGRNASQPIEVVPEDQEPPFSMALAEALQMAVDNRREFAVAGKNIVIAEEGVRVAKAEFLPRVYLHGQFDEADGGGIQTGQTTAGAIHLEWTIFEGGRRIGEKRAAGANVASALAQAQQVADTIAYEVNQAYWSVDDARQRIVLARTSISQAQENYRLVLNKYKAGDATPTDLVDAETTVTRAEQSFNTALYDTLTALARLAYAMGTTPDSCTLNPPGH